MLKNKEVNDTENKKVAIQQRFRGLPPLSSVLMHPTTAATLFRLTNKYRVTIPLVRQVRKSG